ncbi:glutamine--fructose-6-phosphate transaminase (isomerizing) [Methanobrevibacter woesei]|uniref:glutamine--fructose-6-phosphate transaminase (isomerizing) n=1 Tax=Methanobrevibacter woesei TaxID=190976 RepID=UPI0023EFCCB1|nr:glutamine--fructose-6-phosphate transaminase (isomerizing) [Methanobrevibacter woesei]
MCGIVGCILKNKEQVAPILLDCISKLEYRGYDSIGIATFDENINIKKDKGKIKEVDSKLDLGDMDGSYGIAHVRWATHGDPSKTNSHPQTDEDNAIAVVHNGIIENYSSIKEQLENEGHVFKSDTDTEVIPHLVQKFMDEGLNLEGAVRKTTEIIHGAYAMAVISKDEPNKIVATRKDSPLIVGLGEDGYFVASDSPAILKYANNIIYPERGEFVILEENGVTIKDENGNVIDKEVETIDWTPEMAEKEGYDYFMIKEINEQATAVRNTLTERNNIQKIIDDLEDINRICFVACGTSYHASLTGKYLLESLAGIPTDVILASEFKYSTNTLNEHTLVIFISQSGETADTLKALDVANESSQTLGIVNVAGSSMTRRAKYVIQTQAGPEIGVAATKTYLSQLTAIYIFAALMGKNEELLEKLNKVPSYIDELLKDADVIKEMAKIYNVNKDGEYVNDFFFIGRGYSYPVALEGALKLKEITYIHGEGYAAGELKHGPLALIDEDIPVVVVLPPGENHRKTMSNLEEVKSRGAKVLAIGASDDKDLISKSDDVFIINPEVDDIIAPLVYIVPLQLLSYYVAIERDLNPDQPKNLAKCVTVE